MQHQAEFVRANHFQYSALLRSAINQKMLEAAKGPSGPRADLVKAARLAGMSDAQISRMLGELPRKDP